MNEYIYACGNIYLQVDEFKTAIPASITITEYKGAPSGLLSVTYPVLDADLQPQKKSYLFPEQWDDFKKDMMNKWQVEDFDNEADINDSKEKE